MKMQFIIMTVIGVMLNISSSVLARDWSHPLPKKYPYWKNGVEIRQGDSFQNSCDGNFSGSGRKIWWAACSKPGGKNWQAKYPISCQGRLVNDTGNLRCM